jgi:N-acetylneuraminate synthase/N,N'-diacetyllegionaminate synthase
MDIPLMKVGSGEITYLTLLEKIAQTHLPTIISTGMSTLGEIEEAVNIFRELNNNKLILLQCTSNYPTDYKNVNLRAMSTLRYSFDLPIGFSDHTMGITASVAAAALGACVIEKHFTLNRNLPGPDHKASLEPTEFKNLINQIRIVEQCLGTKIKKPLESEEEIRRLSRKSIVARVDIKKGEKITKKMLSYKRPGFGLPQSYMNIIANRHAKIDINKDEIITWEMI